MDGQPQLPFSDPRRNARKADPATSHEAAKAVRWRASNHKAMLLVAYRDAGLAGLPLSDRQAWQQSALRSRPACCWWKRCSELRDLGMIKVVGSTHCTETDARVQTCAITALGQLTLGALHA